MKATVSTILTLAVAGGLAMAAKSLAVKDLPPAVQKTVQDQTKGAEIENISKETEKGVTQYEVETMVKGKHRDFNVDTKGGLLDGVEAEFGGGAVANNSSAQAPLFVDFDLLKIHSRQVNYGIGDYQHWVEPGKDITTRTDLLDAYRMQEIIY